MEVFECIRTRRSVRKYLPKQVEWDKVGQILDAGRMAPSCGNLQNWQFLVVIDEDKRKAITDDVLAPFLYNSIDIARIPCEHALIKKPNTIEYNIVLLFCLERYFLI